jgi:hypothetical protein
MMKIDPIDNSIEHRINQMREIGKIGEAPTFLEKESSNEDLDLKNEKLKLAAIGSFSSVRANNCVFKGKWCYEVTLLSNKLCQIGWCQMTTPFRTKDGVGDDKTSYAYDGYRTCKWHKEKERYGQNWDIGDVIGVCINLDDRKIEFFHNGISQGIAFEEIATGPNKAYFPGISISKNEKVLFNFGGQKMLYNYQGYEPIDIPKSMYTNSYQVTSQLLEIVDSYILKLLSMKEIDRMFKTTITHRILSYIAKVSFKDFHVFSQLIIPYLLKISSHNLNELQILIENLLLYTNHKTEFINHLFDNLSSLIEIYSVRRFEGIGQREDLIKLFLSLLKIDSITQLWIDGRRYVDHLKMIINGNYIKTGEIVKYFSDKIKDYKKADKDFKSPKTFVEFYFEMRQEFEEKLQTEGMNNYEEKINSSMLNFIKYFLSDTRVFKTSRCNLTLKQVLIENYVKSVKESYFSHNDFMGHYLGSSHSTQPNEPFIKYFYFNMLEIFSDIFNKEIFNCSVEPWFTRDKADSLYYDEVGVGGTIASTTEDYIKSILPKHKEKNSTMTNYLLHRILNVTSSYILPILRETQKNYERIADHNLNDFERDSHKAVYIHNFYRSYFSILTKRNQTLLYQFSYFLVKWLNTMIKENKEVLYFIPKSIMQIPYEIFKLLVVIKSPLLKIESERTKANQGFYIFQEDNYLYEVLYFYCYLFNDDKINNPELKEGFINKIASFLKNKKLLRIFQSKKDLLEMLMKGLLKYMANEMMCHYASENVVKIIRPICFGEKDKKMKLNSDKTEKVVLVDVVKKFFEDNVEVFHEFMDNYFKLLNKVMTDYTMSLNEATRKLNSRNNLDPDEHFPFASSYSRKLKFSYEMLCNLMKILEFLLAAYPNEFFDKNTINFSRFSNFLKNLSSRILDKVYIENLVKNFKEIYKTNDPIPDLVNSVLGMFLNIKEYQNNPTFSEFSNKLSSLSDFDPEPFLNVLNYTKEDKEYTQYYEKFKEIIELFKGLKSKKCEKKMTEEEWEATQRREFVCIICYVNEMDRMLIPCRHGK